MKTMHFPALRRALAMMLALILTASLPVLAEDIPLTPGDAPTLEVIDAGSLYIDDVLPELSGDPALDGLDLALSRDIDMALSGNLDLTLEDIGPERDAGNTSKPIPKYDPQEYTMTLTKNLSCTINLQDALYIDSPKADIEAWTNSDDTVATITRYSPKRNSCLFVYPASVGKTTIAIRLTDGTSYRVVLKIRDAYVLRKLSLRKKTAKLLVGQDIDLKQLAVLKPAYALADLDISSSDETVVATGRDCIATALKPGKATITLTSDNGLKACMDIVVIANRTGALKAKPTSRVVGKLAGQWTLWPKALEIKGDGSIACELWLLNDSAGKLTSLKSLDLAVSRKDRTGDTLIARSTFRRVAVNCAKGKYEAVTLTFPASDVYCPALSLPDLEAKDLGFQLYGAPDAESTGKVKNPDYLPSLIPSDTPGSSENPVKYRALLISESDFYHEDVEEPAQRWERILRNRGDVELMKKMLKKVRTPDGSKYSVTTRDDTSLSELRDLIRKTFSGADKNDVSLFFIATHGDSSDYATEWESGALLMASQGETAGESMALSELRDLLLEIPGKVIVILQSCGSGAAVYNANGASDRETLARAAEAFDAKVIDAFRSADPGVEEGVYAANTGELRRVNKFYVLTASAYREECWGSESSQYNYFTNWLVQGVGRSGKMPADRRYAGNGNGMVDLHELYRYISNVGDSAQIRGDDGYYYQHVQVYPSKVRYTLFK